MSSARSARNRPSRSFTERCLGTVHATRSMSVIRWDLCPVAVEVGGMRRSLRYTASVFVGLLVTASAVTTHPLTLSLFPLHVAVSSMMIANRRTFVSVSREAAPVRKRGAMYIIARVRRRGRDCGDRSDGRRHREHPVRVRPRSCGPPAAPHELRRRVRCDRKS